MSLSLPVVEGKRTHWPEKAVCPMCAEKKVFEPHSFAVLSAGALLMDRKSDSGGMSDDLDGFLNLLWHGAHDGGQGGDREICCVVDIMRDVVGGQGEAYFCSIQCLRAFLNKCVDELENKVRKEPEQDENKAR
ncbi:MAG: hypothetical protein JJU05_14600 [Verrucomicrobia bacterium]|nr:hypothetical protein [Verrucomicrobiota bacterium]MCH8528318.1 hypothetical protein [Kiritimatiellia bacterium]